MEFLNTSNIKTFKLQKNGTNYANFMPNYIHDELKLIIH